MKSKFWQVKEFSNNSLVVEIIRSILSLEKQQLKENIL